MTSPPDAVTLLAHAGGWDEALILLGPVIVYLVIRQMGRQAPPEDDPTQQDTRPDDEPSG